MKEQISVPSQTSDEIAWHCKHHTGCGVTNFYESGATLVQDMEVPVWRLKVSDFTDLGNQ